MDWDFAQWETVISAVVALALRELFAWMKRRSV